MFNKEIASVKSEITPVCNDLQHIWREAAVAATVQLLQPAQTAYDTVNAVSGYKLPKLDLLNTPDEKVEIQKERNSPAAIEFKKLLLENAQYSMAVDQLYTDVRKK